MLELVRAHVFTYGTVWLRSGAGKRSVRNAKSDYLPASKDKGKVHPRTGHQGPKGE